MIWWNWIIYNTFLFIEFTFVVFFRMCFWMWRRRGQKSWIISKTERNWQYSSEITIEYGVWICYKFVYEYNHLCILHSPSLSLFKSFKVTASHCIQPLRIYIDKIINILNCGTKRWTNCMTNATTFWHQISKESADYRNNDEWK